MADEKTRFLDQSGLETLIKNIKGIYVRKIDLPEASVAHATTADNLAESATISTSQISDLDSKISATKVDSATNADVANALASTATVQGSQVSGAVANATKATTADALASTATITTSQVTGLDDKIAGVKVSSATTADTANALASTATITVSQVTGLDNKIVETKVNSATNADTATNVAWSGITGKPTTVATSGLTDVYTKEEVNSKLTSAMHYKGSVANVASLPSSNNVIGDFYNVLDSGDNYAWDGTTWDQVGVAVDPNDPDIDLEDIINLFEDDEEKIEEVLTSGDYYTKTEVNSLLGNSVKYVNGIEPDSIGNVVLGDFYTKSEINNKLLNISNNGIGVITVNNIDADENGNVELPLSLAEMKFFGDSLDYVNSSVTHINAGAFTDFGLFKTVSFMSVSTIGAGAFTNCMNLSSVSFPACTTIGSSAFMSCISLTGASFPACTYIGESAFKSCSSLTSVSLPKCTSIGSSAFQNCTSLTTASFPVCTFISDYAFYHCSSLTTASFPKCTTIGNGAFYDCSKLTSVSFPACTSMGDGVFTHCSSLTTASFPKCTTISDRCFSYCTRLTSVNFPNCETIGKGAFYSCYSLTTVNFPACTSIGLYVFSSCNSLTTASFPNCTTIGSYAFYNCLSLTSISFPACTTIGSCAFHYCPSLTSISFPACTTIGSSAFYGCGLTTVNFPKCTSIMTCAFESCRSLTTASFPMCISIGSSAFRYCYNLTSLYLLGTSIPDLKSSDAFYSTPIDGRTTSTGGVYGSIFVRASMLNSFKTATIWSYFSSRFVVGYGYKLAITGSIQNTIGYLNDEFIEDFSTTYPYGNVVYKFYNPTWGRVVYSYNETRGEGNGSYNLVAPAYNTVTYNGLNSSVVSAIKKISITYDGVTMPVSITHPIVIGVPTTSTDVTLNITFDGYKSIQRTDTITSSRTITLTNPDVQIVRQVTLNSTNASNYSTLVDGTNFVVSGSAIQSNNSYNVNNGSSKGYIKFTTPTSIGDDMYIDIVCHCQSEKGYDLGYITIDTTNKYPSRSTTKPANCIFSSYENNGTTDGTYRYAMSQLTPDTDYYINVSYQKDSSANTGEDRLVIKSISYWT